MATVTTTSQNGGTHVRIFWTAPSAHSSAIDSYKILIGQSDGATFTENLANCNGADATIKSQQYCDVPMTVLRASPYSLAQSTVIKA